MKKLAILSILALFLVACAGQAIQKPVYEDLAIKLFIDSKPSGPGYDVDLYFKNAYLGTSTTNAKSEAWFYKLPIGTYTAVFGTVTKYIVVKSVSGAAPYRTNVNVPASAYGLAPLPAPVPLPVPTMAPMPTGAPAPTPAPSEPCIDTDITSTYADGKNLYEKGTTTSGVPGIPDPVTDFCAYQNNKWYVTEGYCVPVSGGLRYQASFECSYGCTDGACNPAPTASSSITQTLLIEKTCIFGPCSCIRNDGIPKEWVSGEIKLPATNIKGVSVDYSKVSKFVLSVYRNEVWEAGVKWNTGETIPYYDQTYPEMGGNDNCYNSKITFDLASYGVSSTHYPVSIVVKSAPSGSERYLQFVYVNSLEYISGG